MKTKSLLCLVSVLIVGLFLSSVSIEAGEPLTFVSTLRPLTIKPPTKVVSTNTSPDWRPHMALSPTGFVVEPPTSTKEVKLVLGAIKAPEPKQSMGWVTYEQEDPNYWIDRGWACTDKVTFGKGLVLGGGNINFQCRWMYPASDLGRVKDRYIIGFVWSRPIGR